ncbi:NAD-binding protein [bacterium]|nr:NAD-binding protein [bacterium]
MRNLVVSIILTTLVFSVGTLGFSHIEGWSFLESFYMTVITLTTIGFREIHTLSPAGMKFTIGLVLIGVGVFAYTVRVFAITVLEGQFITFGRIRKMKQRINNIKNHYIICGYGKNGKQLAEEFNQRKAPFIVIDKKFIKEIQPPLPEYVLYIEGDASLESTLIEAKIDRAKGIITVLPSDADNVFTTMTARGLNKEIFIFAEAHEQEAEKKFLQAGASRVIFPYKIASKKVVSCMLKPNVIDFIDIALESRDLSLEIEEILVIEGSILEEQVLKDSGIREKFNIIVIAIKKFDDKLIFNPGPLSKINRGDTLIAMGDKIELGKLALVAHPET